jgi:hypothetical protein
VVLVRSEMEAMVAEDAQTPAHHAHPPLPAHHALNPELHQSAEFVEVVFPHVHHALHSNNVLTARPETVCLTEDASANAQLDPSQSVEPVDAPTEPSKTDNVSLPVLPHGPI